MSCATSLLQAGILGTASVIASFVCEISPDFCCANYSTDNTTTVLTLIRTRRASRQIVDSHLIIKYYDCSFYLGLQLSIAALVLATLPGVVTSCILTNPDPVNTPVVTNTPVLPPLPPPPLPSPTVLMRQVLAQLLPPVREFTIPVPGKSQALTSLSLYFLLLGSLFNIFHCSMELRCLFTYSVILNIYIQVPTKRKKTY